MKESYPVIYHYHKFQSTPGKAGIIKYKSNTILNSIFQVNENDRSQLWHLFTRSVNTTPAAVIWSCVHDSKIDNACVILQIKKKKKKKGMNSVRTDLRRSESRGFAFCYGSYSTVPKEIKKIEQNKKELHELAL